MADFNAAQAGTMSPEDYAQQQALNRQQRFAEMLMQNNQQPQGQMISGRYVAPSPWQSLQAPVNMLLGAYLGKQSDTDAAKLAEKIRQAKGAKEETITNLITGTPEKTTELAGPYAGNVPMPTAVAPATKPDLSAALREMSTNNPYGAGSEYKAALVGNMIPKKTDEMLNFEAAKADGFKGSFTDYKNKMTDYQKAELALRGAEANKGQIVETPNGVMLINPRTGASTPVMANGQPVMGKNPLTESQGKAAVFHSQMVSASNELNNVYNKGFNPNSPAAQAQTSLAGGMFNALAPSNSQEAKQAQNQWTEAYLRFKTGAGTNASEVEANRKTYFPQIGDKPDAIAQKARMRAQAESDISMAAGPQAARMGAQPNTAAPVVMNPSKPAQATPQFDPNLLQYMTPEQQALFSPQKK